MTNLIRTHIASGVMLILIGSILLAFQIVPGLKIWLHEAFGWPMIIVLVALGLLVIGLLSGAPDMAIPACVVGGLGGRLYFQNGGILTWESWIYLWTLIPGFGGVGTVLAGLLNRKHKQIGNGLKNILVSAVLFMIFGSLFGNILGYFPFKMYLPFALIALGVFLFIRALFQAREPVEREPRR